MFLLLQEKFVWIKFSVLYRKQSYYLAWLMVGLRPKLNPTNPKKYKKFLKSGQIFRFLKIATLI
jgi:hypothetical protein